MRLFIARTSLVFMFIASVLVADGLLKGSVSLGGGLALLPAFILSTLYLYQLSLPRKRRRTTAAHHYSVARQPQFELVRGGRHPQGSHIA